MIPLVVLAAAHLPAVHATATLGLLYTFAGILAGVAIIGAFFTKFLWPKLKGISNFLSDWEGEPARPGVPERPGVMKRLETVEFNLEAVRHEVHLNSGASIKDIAQRTEKKVDDLHARVDSIDRQREGERAVRDD
jgi:hypothetical protein